VTLTRISKQFIKFGQAHNLLNQDSNDKYRLFDTGVSHLYKTGVSQLAQRESFSRGMIPFLGPALLPGAESIISEGHDALSRIGPL
jgi:hypothetical protein